MIIYEADNLGFVFYFENKKSAENLKVKFPTTIIKPRQLLLNAKTYNLLKKNGIIDKRASGL